MPDAEWCCPDCGDGKLRRVGDKPSVVDAFVQAHFRRRLYQRETLACGCGGTVSAAPPPRVGDQTHFAPSFCAHVVVSKCADSIPLYRLDASYTRMGIPVARSTLGTLLHRSAREVEPLYKRCLELVPKAHKINADENSFRELTNTTKIFLWAFVTDDMVVYRYADSRSGDVPKGVLGDSQGLLTVDQHSGTACPSPAAARAAAASRTRADTSSWPRSTPRPPRRSASSPHFMLSSDTPRR